jgi:hypothetical protein
MTAVIGRVWYLFSDFAGIVAVERVLLENDWQADFPLINPCNMVVRKVGIATVKSYTQNDDIRKRGCSEPEQTNVFGR